MENKSLKKNAILNVIKTLCTILFPLITFPYASRILLPEGTGKVNFANSIISYFGIIASLGIYSYAIREASKVRDNKEKLSKFVKEIIIINIISTIIAYILFFISIIYVPKFQNNRILLCVCASNLLLSTIGIDWLYSALEEFKYITIRSILFQFISLILLFIFVKTKDDYIKYAGISVFSSAGSNILNLIHSRKYINIFTKAKLELKKHIKPILILFITSIAINIFTVLDTSMLGFLTTESQVGYYTAASKIVKMIRDLFPAAFTVLFARLSYYESHNDEQSQLNLISKTLNFIFCLSLPMFTGVYILMPNIVRIICGNDFIPSISTARIMSPLLILSSYSGFLGGQVMLSLNKEKTYMWCMIGASISDVILNFIFIPKYGAFGAALATLITEFLIFITYSIILRNLLIQIKIKKDIFQYIISTIFMSVIVLIEVRYINNIILSLIICIITGVFLYGFLLIIQKNVLIIETTKIILKKIHYKSSKK